MEQQQTQPEAKKQIIDRDALTGPLALATLVGTGVIDPFIKGGWAGVGAGALAAAFIYYKGTPLIRSVRPYLQWMPGFSPETSPTSKPSGSNRSLKDRLLGNFPEEVDYDEYIQSDEWKARAKAIRKRDNYTCQDCKATDVRLDVHHLTYARLGHERDEDLIALCRECHDAREDEKKAEKEPRAKHSPVMSDIKTRGPFDFTAGDELAPPTPNGPLYFSSILKTFTPSLETIYLATLPTGEHVFTDARSLCHTALAGATRGGKDHIIRMLMSQLCFAGAKVYLLNPNYTRYDLETVDPYKRPCPEDWTPFEAYLKNDPTEMIPRDRKYKVIEHYLQMAFDMVERRMEAYGYSEHIGAPQFLFVNEIPTIVEEVPHTARYLKKILREGAKVGVFMVNASQDFQVATIFKEIGGGVRKCYRTAFDVGSDPATQNALGLLPLKKLGKGSGSLRYDDLLSAVRLPYVDNPALYALLGPSTYVAGRHHEEEDELVAYAMGTPSQDDPNTEPLSSTRRVAETSYAAYQARKTTHRVAASGPRVQGTPTRGHDTELERGIKAYRAGAHTIDDFQAAMGLETQHQARQLRARVKAELNKEEANANSDR